MSVRADLFRRLFDYENDAHRLALASLEAVPEEKRGTPDYAKATGLLAHLVLARWLWLSRLGAASSDRAPKRDEDFFPGLVDPAELRARLAEMQAAWAAYLARLDDAELDRVVEYRSLDAGGFTNTVEEVVTQLFGHSWYHRGQIASLVKASGAAPAVTDYIFWARRPA